MSLIPRSFLFDDDFDSFFLSTPNRQGMKCDIYEKDDVYHIEMDVPGFNKEDINIEIKDNYLIIKAKTSDEKEEEGKNYLRRERSSGEFSRTFTLGEVDEDNANAKFENGMLFITIPKKEEIDTKKTIEIK